MLKLNNLALCALAHSAHRSGAGAVYSSNPDLLDHRAEEVAIEEVMKQYYAAILAHDGATLSGLFLHDANLWLNVLTDSAYARAQAKSADG